MKIRPALRCTAKRSTDGAPCKAYAVTGATVCAAHGGRAPQTRAAAAVRVAERKALRAMDKMTPGTVAPLEDPVGALLRLASEIAAFKDFMAGRVAEMRAADWRFVDDRGAEQLRAEIALYERALDRTARVLVEINRLGLEERALRNAERVTAHQGEQLAGAIRLILDAMLGHAERLLGDVEPWAAEQLRARWPAWVAEVVPRELMRVAEQQDASRG